VKVEVAGVGSDILQNVGQHVDASLARAVKVIDPGSRAVFIDSR